MHIQQLLETPHPEPLVGAITVEKKKGAGLFLPQLKSKAIMAVCPPIR